MPDTFDFKAGDLVRIAVQPADQLAQIVGKVGILNEVDERSASISAFNLDGRGNGAGTVPLSCLVLETRPEWVRAKQLREEEQARYNARADAAAAKWDKSVDEVAQKYGVSALTAVCIYQDLSAAHRDSWR